MLKLQKLSSEGIPQANTIDGTQAIQQQNVKIALGKNISFDWNGKYTISL